MKLCSKKKDFFNDLSYIIGIGYEYGWLVSVAELSTRAA